MVENALTRFSLGSVDKSLRYDKDGGVTIHLQAAPPEKKHLGNWIPVPQGQFNLFLRAYLPGQSLIDQTYVPPAVRKVS